MLTAPTPKRIRVPIWQVAKESYRSVFLSNPTIFLRLAWFPALAIVVIFDTLFYVSSRWAFPLAQTSATTTDLIKFLQASRWFDIPNFLGEVILIALLCLFAVRWHRFQLLRETVGGTAGIFSKEWRRFTGYTLLIYSPSMVQQLLKIIAEFVPGFDSVVGAIAGGLLDDALTLASIGLFATAISCSLIFPAAAYGRPITWHQAWHYLQGNIWRLIGCCFVAGFLAFVTSFPILALLMIPIPPVGGQFAMVGILVIFELIFVALFASILCGFYRRIVLARDQLG